MLVDEQSIPWGSIIGWSLIVFGWFYTNNQNNQRETRKELRATLDDIIADVDELHLKAIEYYTSSPSKTHQLGFEIKASQNRLLAKIQRVGRTHKNFKDILPVLAFMDVITGNDFERKTRRALSFQNKSDMLLIKISFETNKLIDVLEENYCAEFGKSHRKHLKLNK